ENLRLDHLLSKRERHGTRAGPLDHRRKTAVRGMLPCTLNQSSQEGWFKSLARTSLSRTQFPMVTASLACQHVQLCPRIYFLGYRFETEAPGPKSVVSD